MAAVVVVLGMHRSGTSCATQMLARCGVELGENVLTAEDAGQPSNLAGCYEAASAIDVNNRLLADSGGSWQLPPRELHVSDESRQQMRDFLSSFPEAAVVGWKDPRTVLTFAAWQPLLRDYRMVACLRNPLSVAQSLEVRDGIPIEKGLDLWLAYNRRLLEIADRDGNAIWFDFDQPASWMRAWLHRTCDELKLVFRDEAAGSFIEVERHQKVRELPRGELRTVYLELWHRAHAADVRHVATAPLTNGAAMTNGAVAVTEPGALEHKLDEVIEVLTKYNVVAQRQQRELESLREKIDSNNVRLVASLMDRFGVAMHERVAWLKYELSRLQQAEAGVVAKVDQTAHRLTNDNEQLTEYLRQLVAAWEQQRWDRRLRRFFTRQFGRVRQPN